MKTLLDIEKAVIRYNGTTNAIELEWKKTYDKETYHTLFTKGVEFLKEYKASAWLSDIRKEGVVGADSAKWLQEVIIPLAISYGLKKVAIIMEEDVFKAFYVKNITKNSDTKGLKFIQYFDSVEKANAWLLEAQTA